MSATPAPELAAELTGQQRVTLNIPDLDRAFRLKIRSMVALSIPLMYDQFTRNIDVAALRRAGYGSAVTFAEFERLGGPLAVGAPVSVRVDIRHCELSGRGLGQRTSRLGFECRYAFASPPGRGDPLRYRETVSDEPAPCGRGRLLLTLVRPSGPPGQRIVTQPLDQTRHLAVHVLAPPHPTLPELGTVPPGYTEADSSIVDSGGVFGLQHTDTNQYVYTGEYLARLEDHMTALLAGAGLPAAEHSIERLAAAFSTPFTAGGGYAVRGRLWRAGDRTLALIGIHERGEHGLAERPAVLGRLEGRC